MSDIWVCVSLHAAAVSWSMQSSHPANLNIPWLCVKIINNKAPYDTRYAQGSHLWSTAHTCMITSGVNPTVMIKFLYQCMCPPPLNKSCALCILGWRSCSNLIKVWPKVPVPTPGARSIVRPRGSGYNCTWLPLFRLLLSPHIVQIWQDPQHLRKVKVREWEAS